MSYERTIEQEKGSLEVWRRGAGQYSHSGTDDQRGLEGTRKEEIEDENRNQEGNKGK
jgi:hypothetical protein